MARHLELNVGVVLDNDVAAISALLSTNAKTRC